MESNTKALCFVAGGVALYYYWMSDRPVPQPPNSGGGTVTKDTPAAGTANVPEANIHETIAKDPVLALVPGLGGMLYGGY
jgi:hypothetical protein